MTKRWTAFSLAGLVLLATISPADGSTVLSGAAIPKYFAQISMSPTLANPALLLIDESTGAVVYEKDADALRRPASVLKMFSAAAALEYLSPDLRYTTKLSQGATATSFILTGNFDPWMTNSYSDAQKYHRAWISYLVNKTISELQRNSTSHAVSISYHGVYSQDVLVMQAALHLKGINASIAEIPAAAADSNTGAEIASTLSPTGSDMLKFALTYSDNLVAERLARAAANAAGFGMNEVGVDQVIRATLDTLGVATTGMYIHDGSGYSKENRLNARLIGSFLVKIRNDPRFTSLYEGLPISGVTGTLEYRYRTTAPQAVGLVHAKTGTLDGTVSLAGYVESGTHEYVFVGIADHIRVGNLPTDQARTTLDQLVGKLAAPKVL